MPQEQDAVVILHLAYGLRDLENLWTILPRLERLTVEHVVFVLVDSPEARESLERLGVRVIPVLTSRRISYFPFMLWRLASLIKQLRPSVIHCWGITGIVWGTLARSAANVRSRLLWSFLSAPRLKPFWEDLFFIFGKVTVSWSSGIIYTSHCVREYYQSGGIKGVADQVIYLGVDEPDPSQSRWRRERVREELGIEQDAFVVGYSTEGGTEDDFLVFSRAAALLVGKVPKVKFLVILEKESCSGRDFIQRQVHLSGIGDYTVVAPNAPLAGGIPWVESLDVGNFHYKTECVSYRAIIQAMMVGIRCVGIENSCMREFLGEYGSWYASRDAEGLHALWVKFFVDSQESRDNFARALCLHTKELFSLPKTLSLLNDLYRHLDLRESFH